jgi:hypothetical protein
MVEADKKDVRWSEGRPREEVVGYPRLECTLKQAYCQGCKVMKVGVYKTEHLCYLYLRAYIEFLHQGLSKRSARERRVNGDSIKFGNHCLKGKQNGNNYQQNPTTC